MVPVIDAGLLLGDKPSTANRFVTIKLGQRCLALIVDEVLGVKTIESGVLEDLPSLLEGPGSEVVAALGAAGTELVIALRLARLIPESMWINFGPLAKA